MEQLAKKTKGLIKGTPVAVLVSIGIHAVLIFAAIGWVVFQITKPEEAKFVPVEKIDRPVMKLKKLQVKVQKDARPKQTPERISTETPKVISDIALPEMSGAADGLGAGPIGGFEMMEDLSKMTLFGGDVSIGNDLVGTYYYLMQTRAGAPKMSPARGDASPGGPANRVVRDFLASGWNPAVLAPFWKSPTKLYTTQLFVPTVVSALGPKSFGDTRMLEAALWLVHYKGKIAHPEGGSFRFWGYGDDIMFVRINGELVLDACWRRHRDANLGDWRSSAEEDEKYQITQALFRVGDWFEMPAGELVDMEVLIGEMGGGAFAAILCVEQEGVEYPEREIGGPLLPIFKTAPTPQHILDEMSFWMPEGRADFTGGPIFSAY